MKSIWATCLALVLCSTASLWADSTNSTDPTQQAGSHTRHSQLTQQLEKEKFDLLLIGDSITQGLESPSSKGVWEKFFGHRKSINLGYSGARTENILWNLRNGELNNQQPKAVVLLIGTNNVDEGNYPVAHSPAEVAAGVKAIITEIQQRCPNSKILLVRPFPRNDAYHRGEKAQNPTQQRAQAVLKIGELIAPFADQKKVFYADVNHVFLKVNGDINPALMPDLLHPNALGNDAWLTALEPKLTEILGDKSQLPAPSNLAIVPVPKIEQDGYDWWARHRHILKRPVPHPEVVMIGDSITHYWGGPPQDKGGLARGADSWSALFGERPVLNLGYGWDRTQNVLWRLDQGELDGLHPKQIVLLIGTNNFSSTAHFKGSSPEEVAEGIRHIILRLRAKAPEAKITLMGVLPRGLSNQDPKRQKVLALNNILKKEWTPDTKVDFLDIGDAFLAKDGSIPKELMSDGVHPTAKGYEIWATHLKKILLK